MSPTRPAGRGSAYIGAVLGAFVSIAANIAHSYIPPAGASADWSPKGGAVGMAIFWPVALGVVIEVAARISWPKGWRFLLLRLVGLLPVAGVAAVVSYRHLSGLLRYYDEDSVTVTFGPVAVDGLMLICTTAIIVAGRAVPTVVATLPAVIPAPIVAAPPVARPLPQAVPAGARLLPLVAKLSAPETFPEASSAPNAPEAAENSSGGTLHLLPPPQRGRPAAETRKLFEALKSNDPKLTQVLAAEKLGISRRTLRDALAATIPAEAK